MVVDECYRGFLIGLRGIPYILLPRIDSSSSWMSQQKVSYSHLSPKRRRGSRDLRQELLHMFVPDLYRAPEIVGDFRHRCGKLEKLGFVQVLASKCICHVGSCSSVIAAAIARQGRHLLQLKLKI